MDELAVSKISELKIVIDNLGRIIKKIYKDGFEIQYEFYGNSNIVYKITAGGIQSIYDTDGNTIEILNKVG